MLATACIANNYMHCDADMDTDLDLDMDMDMNKLIVDDKDEQRMKTNDSVSRKTKQQQIKSQLVQ